MQNSPSQYAALKSGEIVIDGVTSAQFNGGSCAIFMVGSQTDYTHTTSLINGASTYTGTTNGLTFDCGLFKGGTLTAPTITTSTPTNLTGVLRGDGATVSGAELSGDVTTSGSNATTIANNAVTTAKINNDAVTYAKIQNVSATDKVLGRSSSGAGDVEEIACTATGRSIIAASTANAALNLLLPSQSGNAGKLLTTDGTDASWAASFLQALTPGGRLTYSSTDPLAYGSSNSSIYYLPYTSNVVAVYDGTKWVMRTFSSINITSFVSDTVYDIFLYDNSGTLAAEKLDWASNTARATALAYQDGVLVKSGDATRRWVGTVYSNFLGVSAKEIGIWNMYNQILRPMTVSNTTSHTYNGTSWRLWNNSITDNRLRFVVGLAGQDLRPGIISDVTNGASSFGAVSVGYDSTTVPNGTTNLLGVASAQHVSGAVGTQIAELGVHTFNGLEICTSANNSTFTSIRLGCSLSC